MKFYFEESVMIKDLTPNLNGRIGYIVGYATSEQPVIGRIWLVQTSDGARWDKDYKFSVMAIPENQLVAVP